MSTSASEAIDPRYAGLDQAPLMPDFCSESVMNLRRSVRGATTSFELMEGPVGNTAALTCVFGAVQRGLPYVAQKAGEMGEHRARCDIPSELLVLDFFVHESLRFAIPPEVVLENDVGFESREDTRRNLLPMSEQLQDIGVGPLAPATPEAPNYQTMLKTVYDRLDWDPAQFHGYRRRVAYPAYPTTYVLRYPLPTEA